jgi:signal transduction histidine kinase
MAFNQGAFLQASNGEIWMGGADGVNVFHPDSIRHKTDFPRILIENIKINDVNNNFKQNVQLLNQLPRLKYNENTLSFDFLALEYNNPESIQFKYRLTGQDTAWVMANNPGFIRFSKLPAGAYILELIATNSDGVWMPASMAKKVNFYIPLPWWRTWWFFLLCIVIVGAAVYGIVAYRFEQALKIERMRVRISSDLHDDVGTILTGLAMQSEILELTANETTKPKLQRISELSRSAMSHMRDTVWAIDARKDKLENLLDRMREHAEETLTPKGIAFDFQVDQLALHKNVPSHIRRNLYLIYKEAITNTAKHSNGSAVNIQLQKIEATGLEMRIHDNGIPLQKEYKTTGAGLANMRMRAEQIGASLQLDTSSGFLIIIHLPRIS